jgi:hypothetical protein
MSCHCLPSVVARATENQLNLDGDGVAWRRRRRRRRRRSWGARSRCCFSWRPPRRRWGEQCRNRSIDSLDCWRVVRCRHVVVAAGAAIGVRRHENLELK